MVFLENMNFTSVIIFITIYYLPFSLAKEVSNMAATIHTQIIMEKLLNGQFNIEDLETICTNLKADSEVSCVI